MRWDLRAAVVLVGFGLAAGCKPPGQADAGGSVSLPPTPVDPWPRCWAFRAVSDTTSHTTPDPFRLFEDSVGSQNKNRAYPDFDPESIQRITWRVDSDTLHVENSTIYGGWTTRIAPGPDSGLARHLHWTDYAGPDTLVLMATRIECDELDWHPPIRR